MSNTFHIVLQNIQRLTRSGRSVDRHQSSMPIEHNAYVAIAIIPIALVLANDFKFYSISIPKSLSLTMIFMVASLVCQYIYTVQMTQLQQKTIDHTKKKRKELMKYKRKRKSLIRLVDNRKSYDLTKWRSKNHPFVNSRYSSYSENHTALSKAKKRVNSWHGELPISEHSLSLRERNALMIPSPPLSSGGETFENNLLDSSDFRSSLFSTSSTIFENDNSRITTDSDSNIVDMSIDLSIDSDNQDTYLQSTSQSKTRYIAIYLYDRFRKGKAENTNNKNNGLHPSCLKPFNLKKSRIS